MRVLMTTAWYPNRKSRGDGVFVEKHARAVARLHDVSVLMVQTDANVGVWRVDVDERVADGLPTLHEVRVYVPRVEREVPLLTAAMRAWWYAVGTWRGYRRIRRRWSGRPDVCHVNVLTRAALLPYVLRRVAGVPYIVGEHWTRYARAEFPHGRLHLWLTRRVVGRASAVCPVSHNLERDMVRWGLVSASYQRVGNVVDVSTFAAAAPAERRTGEPKRLVHVSWMRDAAKNISGLLDAVGRLRLRRTDFELLLVGDGHDKDALRRHAERQGQGGYVHFLPAQEGAALAQTLASGVALVMFSNYENQPVAVLEALAVGRPVVATTVGDLPQMLDGRGRMVEPRDVDGLADAIDWMLDHAGDYDTRALHDYVARRHAPAVIAARFTQLYRQALGHAD